jgi:uncharacterized protein YdiU (UPF0061 family)
MLSVRSSTESLNMLNFDNSFVRELPADPDSSNERRQVRGACYSRVRPTPVSAPKLLAVSSETAALLDLELSQSNGQELAEVFGGNRLWEGMEGYAACYGGHQFGSWAGQLGDGRAIGLGEVLNSRGERWELQLKGAGPTPYSRTADGRAVLRSSVREFLCSEAMHHLGVPTTRALTLVSTGEQIVRDMFYDGNPRFEPGAIVCRVAPSFIRFGNFEIFAARQEYEVLKRLIDFTIEQHFAELGRPSKQVYASWLEEVCRRTAVMIAHWMRVGFVHGVMNTDNMSVLGLTIDYGPYGWLDAYDPGWTPNTTDAGGRRYRFGHQPQVAMWNLARLANAILPLVERTEPLEVALRAYLETFEREHRALMSRKLGLDAYRADEDDALVEELLRLLQLVETDMTLFYRGLADLDLGLLASGQASDEARMAPLLNAYYAPEELTAAQQAQIGEWLRRYAERVHRSQLSPESRRTKMNATNPKYVLRNYLAQLAIDQAESGDPAMVKQLLEVMRRPYAEQPQHEALAAKRPDWARHRPGCSMLSCSS